MTRVVTRQAMRKLLSREELRTLKGIPWSRQHLHRLVKAKKFPAPVKLGPATNAWFDDEVDAFIETRDRERNDADKS
jgi:prophage regulatory protein